jgi:hypothetical protein
MEAEDTANIFASAQLWRTSAFSDTLPSETSLFPELHLDCKTPSRRTILRVYSPLTLDAVSQIDSNNPYTSSTALPGDLKLPDLESFEYGPILDIPLPEESVVSLDPAQDDNEKDVWELALDDKGVEGTALHLFSWEAFGQEGYVEPGVAYISEAGPEAFDALLQSQKVIHSGIFLKSLFALGLGRSSVLFTYDTKNREFREEVSGRTTSGYSVEASQGLVSQIKTCGQTVRHLRDYVEKTYVSASAFPAKVALATAVSSILGALEQHLSESALSIRSLLQLQHAFDRPGRLLSEIHDTVKSMKSARSNEEMATLMFLRCQNCEQEPDWLRSVLLKILFRVSRPWLEIAEEWIGLRKDEGFHFGKEGQVATFVDWDASTSDQSNTHPGLEYIYRPEAMPTFISPEDGHMIFSIGQSLRIIRAHHPDHPLAEPLKTLPEKPELEWTFEWKGVESIVEKAKEYESALADAVRIYGTGSSHDGRANEPSFSSIPQLEYNKNTVQASNVFAFDTIHDLDALPSPDPPLPDELHDIILSSIIASPSNSTASNTVDFPPPISLTPLLSFTPLLTTQSRLLNAATIRLFLRSHSLRTHLTLQRQFHLLGDGVFVSRLTSALFDPELRSTERQRGVMRSGSMGLRLGGRTEWPPASSELRLALMGILSECWQASSLSHSSSTSARTEVKGRGENELPGNLSFAIRQLDDAEAEKILNPESLHALDFLRLQYNPPAPLGAIITPLSLEKYDKIFKFLLRLSRLLFAVTHLPRTGTRTSCLFRLQAHHFVTRISAYFFDTGVSETWALFTTYLNGLEARLLDEDIVGELGTRVTEGVDDLRRVHELCLDRISFALLLRNRQAKVMALLEDILDLILQFSKVCNEPLEDDEAVEGLFAEFKGKVTLFLDVCRGLVGKKGYGGVSGRGGDERARFGIGAVGDENVIERLVVGVDWGGFFGKGKA